MKLNKYTSYGDSGDVIFNDIHVNVVKYDIIENGPNGILHVFVLHQFSESTKDPFTL